MDSSTTHTIQIPNPKFQYDQIRGTGSINMIEVCAALGSCRPLTGTYGPLISEPWRTECHKIDALIEGGGISKEILHDCSLFLAGELKTLGKGDPASNFRYKHSPKINNVVIQTYMDLLKDYREVQKNSGSEPKPVIITTCPRRDRYIAYSLKEEGSIEAFHCGTKEVLVKETEEMTKFLESMGISKDIMILLRPATKGSGYRTYMADMLSFIFMLNSYYHPEMFDQKMIEAQQVKSGATNEDGSPVLQKTDLGNGNFWEPREGHDYLFFSQVGYNKSNHSNLFWVPKEGSVTKVYYQMSELLSLEENGMKQMVREHLNNVGTYGRFSDYWVNDVDDAFTIYMILNAYKFATLTEEETKVKQQLEGIIESVR